jgi:hypothetical protein
MKIMRWYLQCSKMKILRWYSQCIENQNEEFCKVGTAAILLYSLYSRGRITGSEQFPTLSPNPQNQCIPLSLFPAWEVCSVRLYSTVLCSSTIIRMKNSTCVSPKYLLHGSGLGSWYSLWWIMNSQNRGIFSIQIWIKVKSQRNIKKN